GLLEAGVLPARDRQIADNLQAVAAARCPTRDRAQHHLGHEADQPLYLEDMQPAGARRIDPLGRLALGILVPVLVADALIASGAERPPAVLRRMPVAGEDHAADIRAHARVIERAIQLVDPLWPERVPHLGPVERHPPG